MRKIYSLVLMAAALLVGTNAWAQANVAHVENFTKQTSGDYTTLKAAFDAIGAGDSAKITLLASTEVGEVILMDGGNDNQAAGKIINLDLGNQDFSITGTSSNKCIFVLAKGKLDITGKGLITFETQAEPDATYYTTHTEFNNNVKPWMERNQGVCVAVMGSVDPTQTNWSRLIIGENVTLTAAYAAVQLQASSSENNPLYGFSGNKYWTAWPKSDTTSVYSTLNASNNVTLSTIKDLCTDGETLIESGTGYIKKRPGNATLGFGYGINIDIYGHLVGKLYGLQIKGTITANPDIPRNNTNAKFPRINVRPGSTIAADSENNNDFPREDNKKTAINTERKQPTAIYASGYAIWDIQGHVEGANGVYVKMGQIVVEGNAVIKSNATDTAAIHHTSSGVSGTGNAITLQSDWSDGTMGITIKADDNGGTPTIETTANGGAAIVEENTIPQNQVENITIEAGTFNGDVNGCVVISNDFDGDISVSGGTYTGSIETLIEAMKDDSTNVIQTVVAQNGNTATVVIGQKAEGDDLVNTNTEDAIDNFAFVADMSNDIVKLDAQVKPISKDLGNLTHVTVKYLSLTGKNADTLSVVTVGENKTLEVGQIVMNAYGKIVVEAGGKLVVTGSNGIFASKNENLVLKAEEGKSAIFLLSPDVSSNINPKATVEFSSKSYRHRENPSDPWTYVYQFFGSPMDGGVVEEITSSTGTAHYSQFDVFRVNAWDRIGILNYTTMDYSKFNIPFGFYSVMGSNDSEHLQTYTMKGALVGNINPNVPIYEGWSGVSNAYMGKLDIEELLDTLKDIHDATGSNIEGAVYLYSEVNGHLQWRARNAVRGTEKVLNPLQPFMFHNVGAMEQLDLNYKDLVWDPANKPASSPARSPRLSDVKRTTIRLTDEDGVYDYMTIAQSNEFSTGKDFYDAEKYMNDYLNFYAMDEAKMDILSTDDIENTYLGFSCVKGGTMTLSFDCIERNDLVLLDLVTNAIIAMVPGQTYQFTVADNEANDYRFKIIGRQEMPTDIETVEQISSANGGIYTITGQYMGEMNEWNNLPAGLYIVNGEKKVK